MDNENRLTSYDNDGNPYLVDIEGVSEEEKVSNAIAKLAAYEDITADTTKFAELAERSNYPLINNYLSTLDVYSDGRVEVTSGKIIRVVELPESVNFETTFPPYMFGTNEYTFAPNEKYPEVSADFYFGTEPLNQQEINEINGIIDSSGEDDDAVTLEDTLSALNELGVE